MSIALAADTSVAVPLLVSTHAAHAAHGAVVRWWADRAVALSGHALAETYSVLTRLPGDIRVSPSDAARLSEDRFAPPLLLDSRTARRLPEVLSRMEIAGGAVDDALVGLVAVSTASTSPPATLGPATPTSGSDAGWSSPADPGPARPVSDGRRGDAAPP